MKKILKSRIFLVIITAIICITVTAYATIEASSITYNDTTVDLVLDDLYNYTQSRNITSNATSGYFSTEKVNSGNISVSNNTYYVITLFYDR